MRRDDICLYLSPADPAKLEAIVPTATASASVAGALELLLATADGLGTTPSCGHGQVEAMRVALAGALHQ